MRSDTPRYTSRSWQPPTNFDQPPLQESATDLLAGIPESIWDEPQFAFYDGNTPRQLAEHAAGGCLECRRQLDQLKERQQ